jgi:hypothetical protein
MERRWRWGFHGTKQRADPLLIGGDEVAIGLFRH